MSQIDEILDQIEKGLREGNIETTISTITEKKSINTINPEDLLNLAKKEYNSRRFDFSFIISSVSAHVFQNDDDKLESYIISEFSAKEIGRLDEEKYYHQKVLDKLASKNAKQFNIYGNTLSDLKKYSDAEEQYKIALKLKPDYAAVYYNLGLLFSDLEKYSEAAEYFKTAIDLKPDDIDIILQYASTLNNLERFSEAATQFQEALKLQPDDSYIILQYAWTLANLERFLESATQFQGVLKLKPDNFFAHYGYALILSQIDKPVEAEYQYKKAFDLNPDDENFFINYGSFLSSLDRDSEAAEQFKKAIELNPQNLSAYSKYAFALAYSEKYEDAANQFEKAIELDPKNSSSYYDYGLFLHWRENYLKALEQYQKTLEISPDDVDANGVYAVLLEDLEKYPEAEVQFKKTINLQKDNVLVHTNYGDFLTKLKRYPDAEYQYKEAIAIDPNYSPAHAKYANLLSILKRCSEARNQYEQSLVLSNDSDIHTDFAIFLLNTGCFTEAESHVRIALGNDSRNPYYYWTYGNILADEEYYDEAMDWYNKALNSPTLLSDSTTQSEICNNIGWIFFQKGQYYQAKKIFKKATKLDGQNIKPLRNLRELNKTFGDVQNENLSLGQISLFALLTIPLGLSIIFFKQNAISEAVFVMMLLFSIAGMAIILLYKDFKNFTIGPKGVEVQMDTESRLPRERLKIEKS